LEEQPVLNTALSIPAQVAKALKREDDFRIDDNGKIRYLRGDGKSTTVLELYQWLVDRADTQLDITDPWPIYSTWAHDTFELAEGYSIDDETRANLVDPHRLKE
jgi:hypothetical protein